MPDSPPSPKLFLLDGMALVYRAHFAFATNPIRTAAGRNTSAIYGFTNTLLELLTKQNPSHLGVVFDTSAPTARHTEFPAYKAQRQEMPEELSAAIPDVKRLIRAFNIPVLELDGYEADDIIGTLAREACEVGYTTYMVTPDKDFGQLVNPCTYIYRPGRMGDGAEVLGVPEVLAKWGITRPDQVRDILGLWGDTSDNIPGLPGVGEKTAQKLIAQYDTLENALDHCAEQKGKLKETMENFRDQALLSKRLATIDIRVPLPFEPEKLLVGPRDEEALRDCLIEFEFNTLGRRLLGDSFKAGRGGGVPTFSRGGAENAEEEEEGTDSVAATLPETPVFSGPPRTIETTKPTYQIVTGAGPQRALLATFADLKELAVAFDLDLKNQLRGLAFSNRVGQAYYIPFQKSLLPLLAPLFASKGKTIIGHHLKPGLRAWLTHQVPAPEPTALPGELAIHMPTGKAEESAIFFDTALAHSVVFPELRHSLEFAAESLLHYTPIPAEVAAGQQDFLAVMDAPDADELVMRRAMERAELALQLHDILAPRLDETGQEKVFTEIESPLLPVLAAMENEGIRLDPAALSEVEVKIRAELVRLEALIFEHAGGPINIGSPKQLGEFLFGKLALAKKAKKTKTGQYATDEATLLTLAPLHPVIQQILDHREASKLLSTYVIALPTSISPVDGRVHTTFQQMATSTGRLNSQDPNLQNIPIRTAQGREIRRAFVPREGDYTLLSADYSQIELRILAALTQDPGLLDSLTSGEDIHRATAAKVFGLPLAEVTKEQRNQAKMVNYGISYGISAFGLAQRLGIPRGDAKMLIEGYFAQYPGIRDYMLDTVARGRERGYVETITGRRRYLPDLRSGNATVRGSAERNAVNMPIQGSSADLIKIAMVKIAQVARDENWRTKLLLQVHDELVFDLYLPEKARVLEVVRDRMINALPSLRVPIVVETGTGPNWLEAH